MVLGILNEASLSRENGIELDLKDFSLGLDEYPASYNAFSTLRFWRLGLRTGYSFFENKSRQVQKGRIVSKGFMVGGAVDVVQLNWLTLGATLDHYFYEPQLRGSVNDDPNDPDITDYFELRGDAPTTVGPYMRYVPPEILGFPVHVEAYYQAPISGANYTNYGAALVFRPQIYRFDVSSKVIWERRSLSFTSGQSPANPSEIWDLKCDWDMFGAQVAIYF